MQNDFLKQKTKSLRQQIGPFSERSIFPVLPAKSLLSSLQRQNYLNDIRALSKIPQNYYDALYQPLIDNFVEFVQILPSNNEAKLYSMIDDGLLRGLYALKLQNEEGNAKIDHLMNYVLWSAGILLYVGDIVKDRTIMISTKQGAFISEWNPYEGSSLPPDGYYKIKRGGGSQAWLCKRTNAVLGKQLLPEVGFNWISKSTNALNLWLSLLYGDDKGSESWTLFFSRVNDLLEKFKDSKEFINKIDIEIIEAKETALAEDFLEWLKKGIENGLISVNEKGSDIHKIKEGVLIKLASLITKFSEKYGFSAEQVREQIDKLGLTQDVEIMQYQSLTSDQTKTQQSQLNGKAFSMFGPKMPSDVDHRNETFKTSIEGRPMLSDATFYPENLQLKSLGAAMLPAMLARFPANSNIRIMPTQVQAEALDNKSNNLPNVNQVRQPENAVIRR